MNFRKFYAQHSILIKACKIDNRKVRDVSEVGGGGGGSPEERPYDVSRGQNRLL